MLISERRNCFTTLQVRSHYVALPAITALVGALVITLAYILDKRGAWNGFSKNIGAITGTVATAFVLSVLGTVAHKRAVTRNALQRELVEENNFTVSDADFLHVCL